MSNLHLSIVAWCANGTMSASTRLKSTALGRIRSIGARYSTNDAWGNQGGRRSRGTRSGSDRAYLRLDLRLFGVGNRRMPLRDSTEYSRFCARRWRSLTCLWSVSGWSRHGDYIVNTTSRDDQCSNHLHHCSKKQLTVPNISVPSLTRLRDHGTMMSCASLASVPISLPRVPCRLLGRPDALHTWWRASASRKPR